MRSSAAWRAHFMPQRNVGRDAPRLQRLKRRFAAIARIRQDFGGTPPSGPCARVISGRSSALSAAQFVRPVATISCVASSTAIWPL